MLLPLDHLLGLGSDAQNGGSQPDGQNQLSLAHHCDRSHSCGAMCGPHHQDQPNLKEQEGCWQGAPDQFVNRETGDDGQNFVEQHPTCSHSPFKQNCFLLPYFDCPSHQSSGLEQTFEISKMDTKIRQCCGKYCLGFVSLFIFAHLHYRQLAKIQNVPIEVCYEILWICHSHKHSHWGFR